MLAVLGPINEITSRIIKAAIEVQDLLIEDTVVVEIKAVERVLPVHCAQLLTHIKIAGKPAGLLLNFNVPLMRDGITRLLNRDALATV